MNYSLWEILNMAGLMMWVILGFSVIAVAVAIERTVVQWRFVDRARQLHDAVAKCLNRGAFDEGRSACERSPSPMADVYLVGYARLKRANRGAVSAAVNRERVKVLGDLQTRMWILGTIGATAPFVGLAGTVIGIMGAFHKISETRSNEFSLVAGPIAEALIATLAGIIVAVVAVILYNFFNRRLAAIAVETRLLTDEFLELLLDDDDREGGTTTKEGSDGSREAA